MSKLIPRGRWPDLMAVLALVAAAIVVLWRPILRGEVFLPLDLLAHMPPWRYSYERTPIANPIISDLVVEYYPRRLLATQMLRRGELPLWNPHIMSGMPLLADGYSALLYPISMLFVVLPVAQAFGWYALFHLVLAGVGTYWLARGLLLRPLPAALAGLTYMGCGFTLTWLPFPEFSPVIAWLPVALGCVERYEHAAVDGAPAMAIPEPLWRARRKARWGYGVATAIILALCILCQLQLAVYAGAAIGFYWLVRRAVTAPRRLLEAVGTLAGVVALALLLSAAQWLPAVELALDSQRRGAVGGVGQTLGLPGLLRFVAPTVFGRPRAATGWGPPALDALFPYVGLLPLLLAIVGAWFTRIPRRLVLLALALTTLGLAVLPAELLSGVPLLNQLPAVYRWTMVSSLALSLLAAYGLEELLGSEVIEGSARLRRVTRAALLVVAVALLVAVLRHLRLFTPASRYGEYITLLRPQLRPLPVAVAALSLLLVGLAWLTRIGGWSRTANRGLLFALFRRFPGAWRPRQAVLGGAALALVMLDLLWYGLPMQSSANPRQLFQPTADLVAAIGAETVQRGLASEVLYPPTRTSAFLQQDRDLYRVLGADYPSLQPNTFSVFGVHDVRGYASLFSQRYQRFARRWEGKPGQDAGWVQIYLTQAYNTRGLLDLMGVRYIVFNPGSENESRYPGLELVQRGDEGAIYRNPAALPRAFLVHAAEVLPDDETLLRRLTTPGFPLSTTALLTETPPPLAAPAAGERDDARITRYTPLEVDVTTRSSAPGLLVLSDTHYPGWEAFVDGKRVHLYTVDSILRGVAVPAGSHEIHFRYRPRSFMVGAALSVLGLLSLATLWLWGRRFRLLSLHQMKPFKGHRV